MNWDLVLDERVSMEHEALVMNAVAGELEKNASLSGRRWFNWNLIGGLGLLSFAGVGVYHMIRNAMTTYGEVRDQSFSRNETMEALSSLEVASDFDLVDDMDLIENLDDLENWNGVDV